MWHREMKYLQTKGVRYDFVKKTKDYNISVYKYRKTPRLFAALCEFYEQVENEKSLAKAEKEAENAIAFKTPEGFNAAVKELGLQIVSDNGQPRFVSQEKIEDDTE